MTQTVSAEGQLLCLVLFQWKIENGKWKIILN